MKNRNVQIMDPIKLTRETHYKRNISDQEHERKLSGEMQMNAHTGLL